MTNPEINIESGPAVREMARLLDVCAWPSEAFWRSFELEILRRHQFEHPILELGCADGNFTELLGLKIDLGIDLNPRTIREAQQKRAVYKSVECRDMRTLEPETQRYSTVFANSVLEHVPGVEDVLQKSYEMLAPGGALVTTVPLDTMNKYLTHSRPRYVRLRQRQLQHHNLWSSPEWERQLHAAGFETVSVTGYLPGEALKFWDRLDWVGTSGVGRLRVGAVTRRLKPAVPNVLWKRVRDAIAVRLAERAETHQHGADTACLLIARRGH